MKGNFLKVMPLSFCILFAACAGKIEKSWTVTDFSKPHQFKVTASKNKNVVNANVYLSGEFSGNIYLSKIKNDSTLKFTQETLPERITTDFYGGDFDFYLAPSDAKGKLNIRIEVNQYY